ncbi:MAG: hypothetical protein NTZ17_03945 [Phycisphaerae bacterium]|nr:hypothetical protein [Phycisphaerae bacterium]
MIAPASDRARNVTHWASMAGRWSFEGASARYLGPQEGSAAPLGLTLSDVLMRDGIVRLGVTFDSEKFADDRQTSAAVILGCNAQLNGYVLVQLGGWGSAYSLGEFDPMAGFRAILRRGSLDNLRTNYRYEVEVVQRGQTIRLLVDNVPVFEHVLATPLIGNQVGLQAWGPYPIRFDSIAVADSKPRLFVAMQFSKDFDPLFEKVICPVAEDESFDVVRIDSITRPGIIFQDIQREISEAKAVLAEISAPNNNVFYELGYAHAMNKPTILLARRSQEPLPFDIRSYRVIFYDDSIGGKPVLEETLKKHLRSILQEF